MVYLEATTPQRYGGYTPMGARMQKEAMSPRRLSVSHRVKSWPARLLIMGSELTAQKYRFVDAIRSSFTSGLNSCPQNLSGC